MKYILCLFLLCQQSPQPIIEYDEFNDLTKIKTEKLIVLDTPSEQMQITFISICKGNQTAKCEPATIASIGLLLKSENLQYSKSLIALADGRRVDLGEAEVFKAEQQGDWYFFGLGYFVNADDFQRFAAARSLRMQLGGLIEFSFDKEQMAAIRAVARKLQR